MTNGIYTVRMTPVTAGARRVVGTTDFEYEASSASDAIRLAIRDCMWNDPTRNFQWKIVGRKEITREECTCG